MLFRSADVKDEFLSVAVAREEYAVVIRDDGTVDHSQTERLRKERRAARSEPLPDVNRSDAVV